MLDYREFLFVISPGDEIDKDVYNYKVKSGKLIGEYNADGSKAHITIRYIVSRNRRLVCEFGDKLEKIIHRMPAIKLNTKDFSFYNNNNTIYAKINSDDYTKQWFKTLRANILGEKIINPHITIAKSLKKDQFDRLWPEFQNSNYQKSFIADHISILERSKNEKKYTVLKKLYFGNSTFKLIKELTLFDHFQ